MADLGRVVQLKKGGEEIMRSVSALGFRKSAWVMQFCG